MTNWVLPETAFLSHLKVGLILQNSEQRVHWLFLSCEMNGLPKFIVQPASYRTILYPPLDPSTETRVSSISESDFLFISCHEPSVSSTLKPLFFTIHFRPLYWLSEDVASGTLTGNIWWIGNYLVEKDLRIQRRDYCWSGYSLWNMTLWSKLMVHSVEHSIQANWNFLSKLKALLLNELLLLSFE